MGLRLKFNLIMVAIFAAGFVSVGIVANRYLQQQSIDDAKRAANVVLDASAVANFDPRIAAGIGSRLIEMKVREFDTREPQSGIDGDVARRLAERRSNELTDIFSGLNTGRKLVVARLVRETNNANNSNAGNVGNASITRIRLVSIDYDAVTTTAKLALTTLLSSLGTVFFALFFALNLMLDRLIVRPVAEMAKQADAVSVGDFSVARFKSANKDEIGMLGIAFNRMRRSTEEAIKLLKGG